MKNNILRIIRILSMAGVIFIALHWAMMIHWSVAVLEICLILIFICYVLDDSREE